MTKRFNDYTNEELLQISNEDYNIAVRIEAIQRGVQPPVTLSEALRSSEWRGYQLPAEHTAVYEVCVKEDAYSSLRATGVAYLSENRATAALSGLVVVDENRYGKSGPIIKVNAECSVAKKFIGVSAAESKAAKLEGFLQDNTEFDKIEEECRARLGRVRQDDYNRRVSLEKKTEYIRLAGGDEGIAKSFWAKVEKTEWPQ